MTTVTIKKRSNRLSISVIGHAHEAHDSGRNDVCVAISTITQTIAYYLQELDGIEINDITFKDGEAFIDFCGDNSLITSVMAISSGYYMLSDSFPTIVSIKFV